MLFGRIALLVLWAAAGCVEPSQVIVNVGADPISSERATSIRIEVFAPDTPPDSPRAAPIRSFVGAEAIPRLTDVPARLTVVPRDSDPTRQFRVVVSLLDDGGVFSERSAISTFSERTTTEVWLHFDDECIDAAECGGTTTCDAERGDPACVAACVTSATPGTTFRSELRSCGDDCSFANNGDVCGEEGSPGRCWDGSCCLGCYERGDNGAPGRCVGSEDTSLSATGVGGAECVSCDCPGDSIRPDGGCGQVDARSLTAGPTHACVAFAGEERNRVFCWGRNEYGQIGNGTTEDVRAPVQVGEGAAALGLGLDHTCLSTFTSTTCWGRGHRFQTGQATNEDLLDASMALPVGDAGYRPLAASSVTTLGLREGQLFCWGRNSDGACGVGGSGAEYREPTAVPVPGGVGVGSFDTRLRSSCAVNQGNLYCWGHNDSGVVGVPQIMGGVETLAILEPTQVMASRVEGPIEWVLVDVGLFGACGLDIDGRLYCWGSTRTGILPTERDRPDTVHEVVPIGTERWLQVSVGHNFVCGVRTDGVLNCLGDGENGRLGGVGARRVQVGPVGVPWTNVTAGLDFACARRADETVWCWGNNDHGQLGTFEESDRRGGDIVYSETPRRVCPPAE